MWRANKATIVVAAVLVVGIVAYNYYDVMWMTKTHARRGRYSIFTCQSCGRVQ